MAPHIFTCSQEPAHVVTIQPPTKVETKLRQQHARSTKAELLQALIDAKLMEQTLIKRQLELKEELRSLTEALTKARDRKLQEHSAKRIEACLAGMQEFARVCSEENNDTFETWELMRVQLVQVEEYIASLRGAIRGE